MAFASTTQSCSLAEWVLLQFHHGGEDDRVVAAGPGEHKDVEASVCGVNLPGELSGGGKWHAAETKNGDSPGCTSLNPSPERFDEALCGEPPLEKSIPDSAQ
jgi:hypothetical protein